MRTKKITYFYGAVIVAFTAFLGFSVFNSHLTKNSQEDWKATLFILPDKGTFIIDEEFSVTVNVDTNMEINAASGKIYFPVEELEVIGLSKEESIFSLWTAEPSYSNSDGTIQFGGGLPTPGFKGSEGKILTITFKTKEEGEVDVEFEEGLVLADDGKGTNILKEKKGASYALISSISSDLNSDGLVNLYDISILLSNWSTLKNPKADINKDGKVDIADFSILLSNFGQ